MFFRLRGEIEVMTYALAVGLIDTELRHLRQIAADAMRACGSVHWQISVRYARCRRAMADLNSLDYVPNRTT